MNGQAASAKEVSGLFDPRLIFFSIYFLYCELLLRFFSGDPFFSAFGMLFSFSLFAGFFAGAFFLLMPKKLRRPLLAFALLVNGFLFALQSVIRSTFLTYRSFGSLFHAAFFLRESYGQEAGAAILLGLPRLLLFLLPLLFYLFFYPRLAGRFFPKFAGASSAFAMLFISVLLTWTAGLLISHAPYGRLYRTHFDFQTATEQYGLLTATRISIRNALFGMPVDFSEEGSPPEDPGALTASAFEAVTPTVAPQSPIRKAQVLPIDFSEEALHANEKLAKLSSYIRARRPSLTNDHTGLFRGKNLILICAEAYNASFIRPELTPTLWRLTHGGFYFEEYYQPEWGGGTTTGEASFLLGLAPRDGEQTMLASADNNNYFTMGNQLQRLGYSTIAFHNGSRDYYDRDKTHENLGFSQYIANENGLKELCGTAYPEDPLMIGATMDLYLDKEPFCVYYMTLSGHAPYDAGSAYTKKWFETVDRIVGDEYAEKTKNYICQQMELEEAVTIMVQRLEEKGIAEDTVIVLVGDHYPYGLGTGSVWHNDRNYIDDLIKGDSSIRYLEDRNALILWSACLEKEQKEMAATISSPTMSLDILPTLSNLFALEYDSRLLAGRDVFSVGEPLVFWPDMSWVTNEGFFDGRKETFTPREGHEYDPEEIKRTEKRIRDTVMLSRAIMDEDYYGLLFGPDELSSSGEIIFPLAE